MRIPFSKVSSPLKFASGPMIVGYSCGVASAMESSKSDGARLQASISCAIITSGGFGTNAIGSISWNKKSPGFSSGALIESGCELLRAGCFEEHELRSFAGGDIERYAALGKIDVL